MIKEGDSQELIVLDFVGQVVQVTVNPQGTVLWVNIDGMCRLRVTKAKAIELDDRRE